MTEEIVELVDELLSPGDKGEEVSTVAFEESEEIEATTEEPVEVSVAASVETELDKGSRAKNSVHRSLQPKKRSMMEAKGEEVEGEGASPERRTKKGKKEVTIKLGDIVWGRMPNSCFYPAVVTMDHFKFFTKIVKAEPGFTSHDPETGKARPDSPEKPTAKKQYHVQFLGDNRRHWLSEEFVIAYRGACR
jgi:hypothetical protein